MRVIISGSSGQIGTNLALRCLREGHDVLGIDCRPNPWTDGIPTVLTDLRAPSAESHSRAVVAGWRRADAVVHLAGHAKVHELVLRPARASENVAITSNVLELCRVMEAPIVFASSREVYGDAQRPRTCEDDARFERASNPYAASKIAGETMVHAYAAAFGLPYSILRLSNVYGRYDSDLARMERVIPLFIDRIGAGEEVTVYGAEKVLDFTYVDDCVEGIMLAWQALADGRVRNETFNVAYGRGHSLVQLAELVGSALRRTVRTVVAPSRAGELTRYVADVSKAQRLLGFRPTVDLERGIARALAWQQERARANRPGKIAPLRAEA